MGLETKYKRPQLSVIIPVYNADGFLKRCLNSIFAQTYTDYEVILINDGSTDTSAEIGQAYARKDNRIRYYYKENGGSYQARLYGAERAKGIYILFCDADDYYIAKDAFLILHRILNKEEHSALQFGYVEKYNHMRRRRMPIKQARSVTRAEFNHEEYLGLLCSNWDNSCLTPMVWDKVYHRKLLDKLPDSGTAERVFWGDDQIINLHLLNDCDDFLYIPNAFYCYQKLSGGTNRFSMHTMQDMDRIKKYQLSYLSYYQGDKIKEIKRRLFAEVAGCFFSYIRSATEHINETELKKIVSATLDLPSVIAARQYYLLESKEEWDAVKLLREANADKYILKAKEYVHSRSVKERIVGFLKKIYCAI